MKAGEEQLYLSEHSVTSARVNSLAPVYYDVDLYFTEY